MTGRRSILVLASFLSAATASPYAPSSQSRSAFVAPSARNGSIRSWKRTIERHQNENISILLDRQTSTKSKLITPTTQLQSSPNDDNDSNSNNESSERTWTPQNYFPRNLDSESTTFGPLLPIAKAVDDATGGWGLSYADLHPATPRTPVGQIFLATNFCYAAAGLALGVRGEWFLGALTEIAGIVSFWYHYSQLELGKNRSEVRLALLIDYFTAGSALITGGVYMIQAGVDSIPLEAVAAGGAAVLCLSLCWVWEFGYPYLFWHSLWHIFSALTGYVIGQDHISKITGS